MPHAQYNRLLTPQKLLMLSKGIGNTLILLSINKIITNFEHTNFSRIFGTNGFKREKVNKNKANYKVSV